MNLRAQVLSGLRWIAVAKFSTQLISWASTIIVIRILHPNDYGLVAMATIFITFCQLINELGLGAAIVQKKELTEDHLRQIFGLVLLLNGIIFILLCAGSPLIAVFFDESKLNVLVPVLALQFIFIAFSVIPGSILTRDMNFRVFSIVDIISALAMSIATLILALLGFSYWALVLGSLLGGMFRAIIINIAKPFLKRPKFIFSGFGEIARFGTYVTIQRILWYFYSRADIFIVGKMLGKTTLGYYSVAMDFASLPMQKIGGIINQVGLSAYSRVQTDRELYIKYVLKASRMISFFAFPVFFGISGVAPQIVNLLIGEKWLSIIVPLQLLSLVIPLRMLNTVLSLSLNGLGHPEVNVKNMIIACIVMPIAFVIGITWGLKGISVAWIIGYSLWFIFMLTRALPVIGLRMRHYFNEISGPFLVGGIMYVAVISLRVANHIWLFDNLLLFTILILSGVILYSGGMLLFYRDICREVWDLRRT